MATNPRPTIHRPLLALCALLAGLGATALPTDHYAASSRLAAGKWVKLQVAHTGIQQVDDATLRSLGFDDPAAVAVYGYGGALLLDDRFTTALPDDLPRQLAVHTDGKLLFYGQNGESTTLSGLTVNIAQSPYSNYGYYFLTDTPLSGDLLPEAIPHVPSDKATDTHTAAYATNRDVQNYGRRGERWFDANLESGKPTSYRFPIADAVAGSTMRLCYAWGSEENETISIAFAPTVEVVAANGREIKPSAFTRRTGYTDIIIAGGGAAADTLDVGVTLRSPRPTASFVAMDYATLAFVRRNTLGGDAQRRLHITPTPGQNVRFADLPAGAMVWDVTSAANVRPLAIADGEVTPATSSTQLVVFDPAADQFVPTVADAAVAPQDLHSCPTPQMLIVALPQLRQQAEQLAALHRSEQGIDVLVTDADQVYNEFASGGFSAIGLRRFVKMLYDRNPERLRSLLLYGASSFDMRHLTHSMPILPVRECSTEAYMYSESQSLCTDSYFAMLADAYNPATIWFQKPLIAVGRLPVYTTEQALRVNDKIRRFITTPHWQRAANTTIYIADNADDGQYHQTMDNIAQAIAQRKGSLTLKHYIDFFPDDYDEAMPTLNRRTRDAIHRGAGFVHYMGHSAWDGFIVGDYGISSLNVRNYANDAMPVFIFSTCNLGQFDSPSSCLGVSSILADNAAIAAIVYSRESWAKGNEISHKVFGEHLAAATGHVSLGQLWLAIRSDCMKKNSTSTRYAINDLNRNMLGDPEVTLRFPEWEATVALAEGDAAELPPLAPTRLSGAISDAQGNVVTGFNGTATILATLENIPTTTRGIRDADAGGMTFMCGSVEVAKVAAAVKDGRYEAAIVVPPLVEGSSLRFVVYAETADSLHSAAGELSGLTVGGSADTAADTTPPTIVEFYAATAANVATRPTDKLHAVVAADPSGLALGMLPLETSLRLLVDGTGTDNAVASCSPRPDGSAVVEMPIGPLADGRHTATLSVSDNAGNRSESTITFEMATADVAVSLACATAVARDAALFEWSHTYLSVEPQLTILITDRRGQTVAHASLNAADGQWWWDLRDLDGEPVADGTYTASLLATDGLRYTSSAPATFTVLR